MNQLQLVSRILRWFHLNLNALDIIADIFYINYKYSGFSKIIFWSVQKPIPIQYGLILLLAVIFLLSTTIVFLLLWRKHNIFNWTIFCEVIAMLFMIVFIAVAHTLAREPDSDDLGSTHCVFIGKVITNICWTKISK